MDHNCEEGSQRRRDPHYQFAETVVVGRSGTESISAFWDANGKEVPVQKELR